jgi:flagellar biosynthesis chaperone FliJ
MTQDEIRKIPHKVVNGIAIALTQEEIDFHTAPQPLEEIVENLKTSIKNLASKTILANYSETDQRNILMGGDAKEISTMNTFISKIRKASKNMQNSLDNLSRKELETFIINF